VIAGWVCLIDDEPNRVERADSAHWVREEAVARAKVLTLHGMARTVRVVKLDPYDGELITTN
jgi:hypothetical protein